MSEDKRTAERVWECASGVMFRAAYAVLGNTHDAEDAVMDAMCRIVRGESKFESLPCNDMRALAVIYARNTAIDIYNKNAASPLPFAELPERVDLSDSPADIAGANDAAARLTALIGAMPESYRDVLLLKARFDMSNAEIAELLCLKNGAVRARLSRARDWLEKFMNREGDVTNVK